jgi:hypothetical protein
MSKIGIKEEPNKELINDRSKAILQPIRLNKNRYQSNPKYRRGVSRGNHLPALSPKESLKNEMNSLNV